MDKDQVIRVLREMGDLLEIAGENPFEILAYRNGARSLDGWEGDLAAAVEDECLTDLEGIGKGLSRIITELVREGRSREHERIRGLFPPRLPDLLTLSGIGPKRVKALWTELGIDSLEALETAAREGRVSSLKGFGRKTEERIIASMERRRSPRKFAPSERRAAPPGAKDIPEATGRVLVGTSGYAYKEWKGSFYPDDLAADGFLPFYATRFATVEINNSFYRFPAESALEGWASQVPDGFLFAVKANQRITHRSRLRNVGEVTASFVERCGVLGSRLGPILFQLPPNLKRDDQLLGDFIDSLPPGGRYAIEFRHETWIDDAVLSRLSDGNVALVVHDDEKLSVPRQATSNFVYVRLRRDAYDERALDSWAAWFAELAGAKRDVFAYLKHDEAGASPETVLGRWTEAASARERPAFKSAPSRRRTAARKGRKRQA